MFGIALLKELILTIAPDAIKAAWKWGKKKFKRKPKTIQDGKLQ